MWYLKKNEQLIPATAENIIDFLEPVNVDRLSEQEERETEKRYKNLGVSVKCYWDGKNNIIKFLN